MINPQGFRDRSGVALPLALFTLVIAAVMITAVFYVGRLEQRMGYNSIASTQAFEAAESGVTAVMDGWDPTTYNIMATGAITTLPTTTFGNNSVYTATIRRLNSNQFLLQAEGRFLVGGAAITRRQVARVVRLEPPTILPEGALITRLGLEVGGTATIDGNDEVPGGWGGVCAAPGSATPAIVDSVGPINTTGGCVGQACLSGSTPVLTDPANVSSATFAQFGGISYATLASSADKVVGGIISLAPVIGAGPSCNTGVLTNWGSPADPTGPCGNYFPVIYAPGNLEINGGSGQGILLVDGHFIMSGGASFYGVIISQGTLGLNAGQVYGTVMTENQSGGPSLIGGTHIDYSRCAILRASTRAAQPAPVRERGWIQLY